MNLLTHVDGVYLGDVRLDSDIRWIVPHAGGTLPLLAERQPASASPTVRW